MANITRYDPFDLGVEPFGVILPPEAGASPPFCL